MATDIEALAYMYPATMEFPLNHEWAQIYFYLTTKCMDAAGKKIPDDLRCDNLDDYLMSQLCNLKHWIYKKRVNERKRRIRENRPPVVEVEEKPDTQLGLFI
jgi:hypothetical protein